MTMDLKNLLGSAGGQQPPALGDEQDNGAARAILDAQGQVMSPDPKLGSLGEEDPNVTTTEIVDRAAVAPSVMEAVAERLELLPKIEDAPTGAGTFSSHPILNYKIGPFQFEKGTLTLDDPDQANKLRKLIDGLKKTDPRSAMTVREIDSRAAERLVEAHRSLVDRTGDSAGAKQALNRLRDRTGGDVGTRELGSE
jgi:hypothetical protein